ncbi:MAG: 1-acyl-sn-glycerol-3-phosphate acyltransferase [Polyangiaceae bacterium]|nr:1-acyl-sn-glycerol-3-phosphate acyltransferase [Polyangiaceae bacterium]
MRRGLMSGDSQPANVTLFYRALRGLIRAALNVFYRTIEVTGLEHIDRSCPTILACNHHNSIIDPLLLGTFEERQVSFCARDGLFKIPLFGSLLRSVGAIPLRRRSDYGGGSVDNAGAFSACRTVLLGGGVLAIFPEGKTHSKLRIEPLKTGTARIALDAELACRAARDGDTNVNLKIVPVGITYLVRHAFLSDVHVAVGPPIELKNLAAELTDVPEDQAVRVLTSKLENALVALSVHVEEEEDERFIAQCISIVAGIRFDEGLDQHGQSPAERVALAKRVLDAHRWMKKEEPYRTAQLRGRIERYMNLRARLGLGGERPALQHRGERRAPVSASKWVAFFILGAPLALYGLLVSLPPYILLRLALALFRPTTDRAALFKLLLGLVFFGGGWSAMVTWVAFTFGGLWALLFGITILPSAFFAHRYVTETRLHRIQLRSIDTLIRPAQMTFLRIEREAIAKELAEIRTRYLAHISQS